jgi:cell division septal protein FtsQ
VSAAAVAWRRRISPRRAAARAAGQLSPRMKRRLIAIAIACLALAGGYQFWLRDSSLVAVERVEVSGLTSADAAKVRAAITRAARDMTTLHVDREALDRAVAGYPVVRRLEVAPDFPHSLRVHVVEYEPAAIAVADSGRVPVAGDGTILRGVALKDKLPTINVDGALGTEFLLDQTARGAAAVAGGAPAVLRARIVNVDRRSDDGYVAELRDGPELLFGAATRLRAKWAAAARVLADLEARGASYVDLRIPSRPAVGGLAAATLAPVAPAGPELGVAPATTTDTGAVTPEIAQTAVPNSTPTDTATAPTAPSTDTAAPPAAQAPATPAEPLTAGTGGGATAAP